MGAVAVHACSRPSSPVASGIATGRHGISTVRGLPEVDIFAGDKDILSFGGFTMDARSRVLCHGGKPVKATPRVFDTLLYLVRHAGRVVDKDELLTAIWGDRVVEESNLSQTIYTARKILQMDPGGDRWIVTAPGRGYRFTAEVLRDVAGSVQEPPLAAAGLAARVPSTQPGPARSFQRTAMLAALAVLLAVAGAVAWRVASTRRPSDAQDAAFAPPPHSLAVLAFENMGGDPAQEYFSDGLADELINTLSRIDGLRVAARTSAFSFKGKHATIQDIARSLHVGAVLEGSVLREAGQVRVNVQLIDAMTGFPLWSRSYGNDLTSVLNSEAEIAGAAAESLRVRLLGEERARLVAGGTHNPLAFDAYLRGLTASHASDGAKAALAASETAIALDPDYALARTLRSQSLRIVVSSGGIDDAGVMAKMEAESIAEAQRAVALAPQLGAAHAALGAALEEGLFDFRHGAAEIARGRALAPSDAETNQFYADMQIHLGHLPEAIEAASFGVARDPLAPFRYLTLASVLSFARHYDAALAASHHMAELEGHPTTTQHYLIGEIQLEQGKPAEALKSCAGGSSWALLHCQAIAYDKLGQHTEAMAALSKLRALLGDAGAMQYVTIFAQWGQPDDAIRWLQTAYRLRDPGLIEMKVLPLLDPIRGSAVFQDIQRQMDFPP
jgi:TolB-like protein/DNA-binding winged helix-turn-helix (wHTH) protein/tetratricopeptide (TPR) repeat protein